MLRTSPIAPFESIKTVFPIVFLTISSRTKDNDRICCFKIKQLQFVKILGENRFQHPYPICFSVGNFAERNLFSTCLGDQTFCEFIAGQCISSTFAGPQESPIALGQEIFSGAHPVYQLYRFQAPRSGHKPCLPYFPDQ